MFYNRKFWAGFFFHVCLLSLNQDMIGKENYIRMMELGWIDWRLTVPLALIGIYGCALLYKSKSLGG